VRLFDRRRAEFVDFELRKQGRAWPHRPQLRHGILHENSALTPVSWAPPWRGVEANYLRGKYLRLFVAAPR
jgi:hypothetical protein